MTEPIDEVMAAEAARAQAEARRKRILDKANKRLGVVSGEQAQPTDEKVAADSKVARIRAARQRRYGRKDVEPATTLDDSKKEEPTEAATTADPPVEEHAETQEPFAMKENFDKKIKETEEKQDDPAVNPELPTTNNESFAEPSGDSITEPKKKYLGVARMRRQMIKKKKTDGDQLDVLGDSTAIQGHVEPPAPSPGPLKVQALPIYMHILTIFLLFVAGVEISCQLEYHNVRVYSELAIQKHGIALIQRSLGPPLHDHNAAPFTQRNFHVPSDVNQLSNEFQDEDVQDSAQNIDPLFRVDLDELTKGPGVMNGLARGAVSVHRSIVWLVYVLPLSMVQASLRIPQALLRSPPTLCLVALAVRHLLGKAILGAGIPQQTNESEKGPIDILAMAKNFVINFVTANFPTLVGLYDAFTHLRTDMYILLCGMFSGLVWLYLSPMHPSLDIIDEQPAHEEL